MTSILLDNASDDQSPCWLFEKPLRIIRADCAEEVAAALADIDIAIANAHYVAGFFSYELGHVLESRFAKAQTKKPDAPLLWFGVFQDRKALNRDQASAWLGAQVTGDYAISQPKLSWDESAYASRFAEVKEALLAGDIYQLNLTFRAAFSLYGDIRAFYRDLRAQQPVKYGAFIQTDGFQVLSLSPEMFLRQEGRHLETRPMKGTAARGETPEADEAAQRHLSSDEKSRAENLMIVDLMRHDLGRIAELGSVKVKELFTVETYPTLHQMTSTIEARVRKDVSVAEMVRAVFPPGSITGAPKIRAMEIINELEDKPRGVYTGAIGMFTPQREALFNVAIRTLFVGEKGQTSLGIGSGVVFDSDQHREYEECCLKMAFLEADKADFELLETLRYDRGKGFFLLEGHLARLKASAAYFGFTYRENDVRHALHEAAHMQGGAHLRIRLALSREGAFDTSSEVFTLSSSRKILRYALADVAVNSANVLLYHKTSRRQFLEEARARAKLFYPCEEVLFVNERGEMTQGSYTNIFIKPPHNEVLLTPPAECGLLPGVLREELLKTGKAREAILRPDDLHQAEAVFLGNSLRGLLCAENVGEKKPQSAAA
jgi:para-aminobenzoate synthetase/4-amino-4-deoxychorismate lyase